MANWNNLKEELQRWETTADGPRFWWRDDDAIRPGPRLSRLMNLSKKADIPVALSIIPQNATNALAKILAGRGKIKILVHGFAHRNYAPAHQKKSEFGNHRAIKDMVNDAANGWKSLENRFPKLTLPVFVPPWNRIDSNLLPHLSAAGLCGLSRFGRRVNKYPTVGLLECNCHLDLVNWRGGRCFIGENHALNQLILHLKRCRENSVDQEESCGILSHHNVMDTDGWNFLSELFDRTKEISNANWLPADEVFRLRL